MVKNTIIIIAIALGILGVWEFGMRIFSPQFAEDVYNNGIGMNIPDEDIGYVLAPNAMNIHRNPEFYPDQKIEYRISGQGFRDEGHYDPVRKPDTIRILVLGDSFAFGIGNQYRKIWPVILEKQLRQRGYAVEVIKAGIYGYDTRREVLYLQKLYPRFRPDIVVINFLFNDLFTNLPISDRKEEWQWSNKNADSVLAKFANTKVSRLHVLAWVKKKLLSNDYLYSKLYMMTSRGAYFDADSPQLKQQIEVTRNLFIAARDYLAPTNTELVVLSTPQNFQVVNTIREVDTGYVDRVYSKIAREEGFRWISSRRELKRAYAKDGVDLYYRVDGHVNNRGNRILGEHLANRMEDILRDIWWFQRLVDNGAGFPGPVDNRRREWMWSKG